MTHGKGLPPEMNEYLRDQIKAWLEVDPARTASSLSAMIGVKPATISNIRNHGRGAGWTTASGFAKILGITIDEMQTRAGLAWRQKYGEGGKAHGDEEDSRPTASNRPGWTEAEAAARLKYSSQVAPFSFRLARQVRGLSMPDEVTPEYVRDLAILCQKYATDADRERAGSEEAFEADSADQARWEAHVEAAQKAKAAGKPIPLPKLPPGARVPRTIKRKRASKP